MLVDPEISRVKLQRELAKWEEHAHRYRERGWSLARRNGLELDVTFAAPFKFAPDQRPFALVALAIRLNFADYDLKPPSLEFVDPFTGGFAPPLIQALEDKRDGSGSYPIIHGHPSTERPFFCAPGNLQYHIHPQHSGEVWPIYRAAGEGRLLQICERVWRATTATVRGWQSAQTYADPPLGATARVQLLQLTDGAMAKIAEQIKAGGEVQILLGGQ